MSPGGIQKNDGDFSVMWGGKKTAKHTTKKKAQGQLNLLRMIEHGGKPTGKPAKRRKKK